jgi:hypothetical protein
LAFTRRAMASSSIKGMEQRYTRVPYVHMALPINTGAASGHWRIF